MRGGGTRGVASQKSQLTKRILTVSATPRHDHLLYMRYIWKKTSSRFFKLWHSISHRISLLIFTLTHKYDTKESGDLLGVWLKLMPDKGADQATRNDPNTLNLNQVAFIINKRKASRVKSRISLSWYLPARAACISCHFTSLFAYARSDRGMNCKLDVRRVRNRPPGTAPF